MQKLSNILQCLKSLFRKPKKRTPCTVDYSKRYKIHFMWQNSVAVDCEVCGTTYWAKNLKSLKSCINEMSDCEGEESRWMIEIY
jgi:hypothetical protein